MTHVAPVPKTSESTARLRRDAQQLIARGNRLRDQGLGSQAEALAHYQQAIDCLTPSLNSQEDPGYRDDLGSAWTNQGIAWMGRGDAVGFKSALACFEQALAVREPLLRHPEPRFRYHLAGVWLNHGDALRQIETLQPGEGGGALTSYDRAIALMRELSITGNPPFCRRLMLAWHHRGTTLLRSGGPNRCAPAIAALNAAIQASAAAGADRGIATLTAAVWVDQAEALGEGGFGPEARAAARQGIAASAGLDKEDPDGALIGLRGRLALCLIAARFSAGGSDPATADAPEAEAIEAAEDGLRLAAGWPDAPGFAPLTLQLFRAGAEGYARWQPQFLVEYLHENLPQARRAAGPGAAERIAAQAIALALGRVARDAFPTLGQPGIERALATFRELRQAAEQWR